MIKWDKRYSQNEESDKYGRWARIAYAGDFKKMWNTKKEKIVWEIAWITKQRDIEEKLTGKFFLRSEFPCGTKQVFNTEEEAQKFVEYEFKKFIKYCSPKLKSKNKL